MVLYTPKIKSAVGEVGLEVTISQAVNQANIVFENSDVAMSFNMLLATEIDYDESGVITSDLAWLEESEEVLLLRDSLGADLVSLVVEEATGGCGLAPVTIGPFDIHWEESAYAVMVFDCMIANYLLAHEHGHNLGLRHDPQNDGGLHPAYPWAFGHIVPGSFRTIMAYPHYCVPDGSGEDADCPLVPYFSNPDKLVEGVRVGIPDLRDNHRALNLNGPIAQNFRCRPKEFSDVKSDDWFGPYVRYVRQYCVVDGLLDGTFGAGLSVSRAEILKMAYVGARLSATNLEDPGYADVEAANPAHWFWRYAYDATNRGYISSRLCLDGSEGFCPGDAVTRYEAAKMVHAVFNDVDFRLPEIDGSCDEDYVKRFPDVDSSEPHCLAVEWMTESQAEWQNAPDEPIVEGYILDGGENYFGGDQLGENGGLEELRLINRAEAAKIIANSMSFTGKGSSFLPDIYQVGFRKLSMDSKALVSDNVLLGRNYEQIIDPVNLNPPSEVHLPGGDSQYITSPLTIAPGEVDVDMDVLFYRWHADGGNFSTTDPTNFSIVTWSPPAVAEETTFTISVLRGDRRGKVGRGTLYFTVPASGSGSNSPASGSITSPSGTQTGNVTVQANASDSDGLERVSLTFVSGGQELVLCGSGASPCSGTSDSFSIPNVDPSSYGATAGQTTLRLFVEDSLGEIENVASRTFTYNPPGQGPSYTLMIRKQGDGDGTVSGGGINCGPGCTTQSVQVPEDTSVTLLASEDAGSVFVGFAGVRCYGTGPCDFTMSGDLDQRVSFGLPDQLGVLFSTPGPGDGNVSPNDQVRITFNREVNQGPNFSSIVFREKNGPPIAFNPVISNTGSTPRRRLSLIPSQQLERSVTYEVDIPAGAVEDDAGNDLPLPYPLEFTVAEAELPNMYITAYPLQVMEDKETRLSIWFDTPAATDRTLTITSSPAGILDHDSSVVLLAGEVLKEIQVEAVRNSGSTAHTGANLSVSAPGFAQESVSIQVKNDTNLPGTSLSWQSHFVFNDDNGNGTLESGEFAEVQYSVWNQGGSTISNVVLNLAVLNTGDLSLLGGSNGRVCNLGSLQPGHSTSCSKDIRVDDELPTGDYYIEVTGSSSGGGFLDQAWIPVVNTSLPDYTISIGPVTSNELDPGRIIDLDLTPRNSADGFNLAMVPFEIVIEIEGVENVLYSTVANSRGAYYSSQDLNLPIVVPSTPGEHLIRARINQTGSLAESNSGNNVSVDRILRTKGPNQTPVLNPIGGPFSLSVGEALQLTASATDSDNDPITYSLGSGSPAGMGIGLTSGILTWTPSCGENGFVTVEIIATDNEDASDSEMVTINVGVTANLQAQLAAANAVAVPGTTVDWTLTVSNLGPSCTSSVDVTNILPIELSGGTWACSASSGSTCAASGTGDIVDSIDLAAGGTATYSLSTPIANDAQGSVVNSATVSVTGATVDPNPNNNTSSDSITLVGLDYGDAPSPVLGDQWMFPTQLADDGARHAVDPSVYLGIAIDVDPDGQPTLASDGDDLAGADDDDGVAFAGELVPCASTTVDVTASVAGLLDAWIDFNTDGQWQPEEQVFTSEALITGLNTLPFSVPCSATPSSLAFTRFRFSSLGGLGTGGLALDGEVEDSGVLIAQVFHSLNVSKTGVGSGTIVASPNGIQCGSDCQESYATGSVVVLSAPPDYGSTFLGWSGGGCSGIGTCVLQMDQDRSVTATFGLADFPLNVGLAGSGSGTVNSNPAGINCGSACSQPYTFGTMVTLTASPSGSSSFTEWSGGGCTGTSPCTVQIDQAISVTATFDLQSYALAVTNSGTGTGTVTSAPAGISCGADCSEPFVHGTVVTLSGAPGVGSEFGGWSGAGCSGTGTCQVTVDAAKSVTATFTLLEYNLAVTLDGDGSGTVTSAPSGILCGADCGEEFAHGTVVTLTAAEGTGSEFVGWTGGGCSGIDPCNVTMDTAKSVTATFELLEYALDVTKDGTGAGTVTSSPIGVDCGADCTEDYSHGTSVTLSAVATAGSEFTTWTGAGCSGTGTCVVTMDAAKSVTATFTLLEYELTVTKSGGGEGTVTSAPAGINCGADCSETLPHGSVVTLTANPDGNSLFDGWSGAGCSGTGTCVVTMDAAKAVVATFEPATFDLTVNGDGTGTGAVTSVPAGIDCGADCSESYSAGTGVTLTATQDAGSEFIGWSGAGCSGTSPCIVTMDAAKAVAATFDLEEHNLTVTKDGDGEGTITSTPVGIDCGPDCSFGFTHGTVVTLTATPETGSHFESWSSAGCSGSGTCEVALEGAETVTATFGLEDYTVSVVTDGDGEGTVSSDPSGIDCGATCSVDFPFGTEVTLDATPQIGSTFMGWTSASCTGMEDCTFNVDEPASFTATFVESCIDAFEDGATNWSVLVGPGDGGGTAPWAVVTSDSNSPTHSWFASDEEQVKDQLLQTAFRVPVTDGARLRFFHRFDTEAGFDGGVLEVSTDGGTTWFDILDTDGAAIPANPERFVVGGYNSTISDCCSSPLANRAAWSGATSGWEEVTLDLADFEGYELVLRWRIGADNANAGIGWWIDDVAFGTAACPFGLVFYDGFETGDTSRWSNDVP